MKNFLVAYDILDKRRLNKVRRVSYSYTIGGQKSALETPLDKKLTKELLKQLKQYIKKEDKINIVRVLEKPILLGKASQISYENNGVIIL